MLIEEIPKNILKNKKHIGGPFHLRCDFHFDACSGTNI